MTSVNLSHDLACEHVSTCDACGALLTGIEAGPLCPDCEIETATDLSAVDALDSLHRVADWLSQPGHPRSHRAHALALRGLALSLTEYLNDPAVGVR